MKFQAIIFDFDGVIADSETMLNQALADGLTTAGLPTSLSDSLRDYSGKRWADILTIIEGRLGHELPSSFIGQQIAWLGNKVMRETKPVPGIDAFLAINYGSGLRSAALDLLIILANIFIAQPTSQTVSRIPKSIFWLQLNLVLHQNILLPLRIAQQVLRPHLPPG
jgi:hypothetical protein